MLSSLSSSSFELGSSRGKADFRSSTSTNRLAGSSSSKEKEKEEKGTCISPAWLESEPTPPEPSKKAFPNKPPQASPSPSYDSDPVEVRLSLFFFSILF